ncbi:hypothetical protein Tco_0106366 [Tanacetum coccineum]
MPMQVKCYNFNRIGHITWNCTRPKRPQNSDYFKDKMLLMQAQENDAVLDEEELLFRVGEQGNTFDADVDNQPVQDLALNEDNIFQADECDAFDSDVDDEPIAQSGQQIHKLDEHEVYNEVQQANVIDSTSVDMGNSNVIPYEQYLSVAQFCDSDLEVAFRKHTCFVRDLDGVDLIKGSHGTNLYTISVEDMMRSSPICLLLASSPESLKLWHSQ